VKTLFRISTGSWLPLKSRFLKEGPRFGQRQRVAAGTARAPARQVRRTFLPPEFRAGERLRSDYTRGNIMPRLGANWVASVASGERGGRSGIAELTDAALAARQRRAGDRSGWP
jgi:hypothetical protein